jgi:hypothetical protein
MELTHRIQLEKVRGGDMAKPKARSLTIDTRRYHILTPTLPFVDVYLQSSVIRREEYDAIVTRAAQYPDDPRLVEMVRRAGDASAKVPYLMAQGETSASILETLRGIARPHVERMESLPAPVRSTIHLLLSMNTVPRGCEKAAIPALLELDRIQEDMVGRLHELMSGRQLAQDFHQANHAALQMLDQDWPRLRQKKSLLVYRRLLPEEARMQYEPFFDRAGRFLSLHQACVILDPPMAHALQTLTPPVLQRPLPADVPAAVTGSADWLIREVGKVGHHFTRALLEIIKAHLAAERVTLEIQNYERIQREAGEALREYIEGTP